MPIHHLRNMKSIVDFVTISLLLLIPSCCAVAQSCPPAFEPDPLAVGPIDYMTARDTCTDGCLDMGYCCTNGYGGGNTLPCNMGCHIAFFANNLTECEATCTASSNDGDCYYTHPNHEDVGYLGYDPSWLDGGGVGTKKCGGSLRCVAISLANIVIVC